MKKADLHVPVLIVGGGGAGLTSSILLSRLGIDSLLISRYAETSQMPKAHILNQRTMEIFSDAGVAPRILARSAPPENMRGVGWYIGATSSDPAQQDGCGRRLAFAEGWGGGYTDPDYVAASPCASVSCISRATRLRSDRIAANSASAIARCTACSSPSARRRRSASDYASRWAAFPARAGRTTSSSI